MRGLQPDEQNPRIIAAVVNQIIRGGSNAVGTVTLTADAATTQVTRDALYEDATILLDPQTQTARNELASGNIYVSAVVNGSFTISHLNSSVSDRTFRYLAIGG